MMSLKNKLFESGGTLQNMQLHHHNVTLPAVRSSNCQNLLLDGENLKNKLFIEDEGNKDNLFLVKPNLFLHSSLSSNRYLKNVGYNEVSALQTTTFKRNLLLCKSNTKNVSKPTVKKNTLLKKASVAFSSTTKNSQLTKYAKYEGSISPSNMMTYPLIILQTKSTRIDKLYSRVTYGGVTESIGPSQENDVIDVDYERQKKLFLKGVHYYNNRKEHKISYPLSTQLSTLTRITTIEGIKIAFVDAVCSSLINSPNFMKRNDSTHMKLKDLSSKLVKVDPEYILKVALYARQDLHVRTTSNFLIALSVHFSTCHPYLKKYYNAIVQLPSDWKIIAELYQNCFSSGTKSLPSVLRKAMTAKFVEFDQYQLAKYNKDETKRKKKNKEKVKDEKKVESVRISRDKMISYSLKQLIRQLHITRPAYHVMCLIGKKYPESMEDYYKCGLEGTWEQSLEGVRMKLPTPETWETQISARGNFAEVWQDLLDHKALPYMAMLRNIRNLIKAGISSKHHKLVLNTLSNETSVARSRQFPFRFFSAYVVLDQMQKELEDQDVHEYVNPWEVNKTRKSRQGKLRVKSNKIKLKYDEPILSKYRKALDVAIGHATRLNVQPIKGRTFILCEVSNRMIKPCNSTKSIGSKRDLIDVAILMALMAAYACEQFMFIVYASSTSYKEIKLEKGGILENLSSILSLSSLLRETANDDSNSQLIPFELLNQTYVDEEHYDNMVVIAGTIPHEEASALTDFHERYMDQINSRLMLYNIDLSGEKKEIYADGKETSKRYIKISGFSDNILRYIAEGGGEAQMSYIANIDKTKNLVIDNSQPVIQCLRNDLRVTHAARPLHVKVFVSSTFKDMHAERNLLVQYVFPELCRRATAYNIQVTECDLRWGITSNEGQHTQTVKICLNQVKQCQLFIGIIGDRYGWIPKNDELPSDREFDWLQSLHGRRSMTELEIHEGAFRRKEKHENVYFYMRDASSLNKELPKRWRNAFIEKDLEKKKKLKRLKSEIRKSGFSVYDNYSATWGGELSGKPVVSGLDELGERMLNDLWSAISKLSSTEEQNLEIMNNEDMLFIKAASKHQQRLQAYLDEFVGQEIPLKSSLSQINHMFVNATCKGSVLSITGQNGIGKSSFMSALAHKCNATGRVVLIHYIGDDAYMSNDVCAMLNGFSLQLASILKLQVGSFPSNVSKAFDLMWSYVETATKIHHVQVCLFIDQLDLLNSSGNERPLQWIPARIPANVMLVVSCLEGKEMARVINHRQDVTFQQCPMLGIRDKTNLAQRLLLKHHKHLDTTHYNNQLQILMLKKDSGNPLYLHTACEFLRMFAHFDNLRSVLNSIPHYLPSLLQLWLQNTETEISSVTNPDFVSMTCAIIHCYTNDIEEEELFQILCYWSDLLVQSNTKKNPKHLSRAVYCRILYLISPFLMKSVSEDVTRLSYAHLLHIDVISARYLKDDLKVRCNKLIASFHMSKVCDNYSIMSIQASSLCKIPYHLKQAGDIIGLIEILSNFEFVKAKCKAGHAAELLKDFILVDVLELENKNTTYSKRHAHCDMLPALDDMKSFISTNLHIIDQHPSMIHQLALNYKKNSAPSKYIKYMLGISSEDVKYGPQYLVECLTSLNENYSTQVTTFDDFNGTYPTSVSLSPNNKHLVCGTHDGIIHIFNTDDKQRVFKFAGKSIVSVVHFLSNKFLISAHSNGDLNVWEISEGILLDSFHCHTKCVSDVCANVKMSTMVSSAFDRTLKVWQLSSNRKDHKHPVKTSMQSIKTDGVIPNCVDIHPDLLTVTVGLWDSTLRVWELSSGKRLAIMHGSSTAVTSVKYSSCGSYIMSTSLHNEQVIVWSSTKGTQLGSLHTDGCLVSSLKSITSINALVVAGRQRSNQFNGMLKLWHEHLGREYARLTYKHGSALCCSIDASCTYVAVGYHENTLLVYNLISNQTCFNKKIHSSAIRCLCWCFKLSTCKEKDVQHIVTGSDDSTLKITSLDDKVIATCKGHSAGILSVACTVSWIASSSEDLAIILWSTADICEEMSPTIFLRSHDASPTCVAFNNTSCCLASGGKDCKLIYWKLSKATKSAKSDIVDNAHKDWITCCSWNDKNDYLVTGSNDCTLKLWSQRRLLHHFEGLLSSITSIAYSQTCIMSCTTSGKIDLWLENGTQITTLNKKSLIKVNCCDLHVRVWQRRNVKQELDFDGDDIIDERNWATQAGLDNWMTNHIRKVPGGEANSASCDFDCVTAVTAHDDGIIKMWDPLVGQEQASLSCHGAAINNVSSSSKLVVSSSFDGTAKLWEFPQDEIDTITINRYSHTAEVTCLIICDNVVLSGCNAGQVIAWMITDDLSNLSMITKVKAHQNRVAGIVLMHKIRKDETYQIEFLTCGFDGCVKDWKLTISNPSSDIKLISNLHMKSPVTLMSKFMPSIVVIGNMNGNLTKVSLQDGIFTQKLLMHQHQHSAYFTFHLIDPSNKKDVFLDYKGNSTSNDSTSPRYFVPSQGSCMSEVANITNICGRNIVSVCGDSVGMLHVPRLHIIKKVHDNKISSILDLEENNLLVTSSLDRTIKIWKKDSLEQVGLYNANIGITVTSYYKSDMLVCADISGCVSLLRLCSFSDSD